MKFDELMHNATHGVAWMVEHAAELRINPALRSSIAEIKRARTKPSTPLEDLVIGAYREIYWLRCELDNAIDLNEVLNKAGLSMIDRYVKADDEWVKIRRSHRQREDALTRKLIPTQAENGRLRAALEAIRDATGKESQTAIAYAALAAEREP